MDTDKEDLIEIDLSKVNQDWSVDGHGDSFVISSGTLTDTFNMGSGSYTLPDISTGLGPIPIYTSPNTSPSYSWNDITMGSFNPSNKISINGPDADIEINGESVVSVLREIRDRLNILQVSKEMEQEWDELRTLREQYEAKLTECREKSKMWATLKQMPAPEIK